MPNKITDHDMLEALTKITMIISILNEEMKQLRHDVNKLQEFPNGIISTCN